jgi:hypothetical protein
MGDDVQPGQRDLSIVAAPIDGPGHPPAVPGDGIAADLDIDPPDPIADLANTAPATSLRATRLCSVARPSP